MLNNFRNLQSLFWSHGTRWLLFRVSYALRKRTGYIRRQMPRYQWHERPLETWLQKEIPSTPQSYFEWRRQNHPRFFFENAVIPENASWDSQAAIYEADRILGGELQYFSHSWHATGFPPDWHKDPVTRTELDAHKHWSEYSDDSGVDIKFIWEPSRFAMVYTLVRAYASSRDERYAEAFWNLIQSWAESNPPNTGPNWMDGQEAALRLMAWTFGYYQFFATHPGEVINSPSATPARIAQFTILVAAHAERIYQNIDYAISTHSNHAISEAFGLWLVGLLFPELKDSKKYFDLGRKLLEQEAAAQIFPDGGYSMYSLNYHRFTLHLYLCAIRLGDLNGVPLSKQLQQSIAASINYLSHLIDPDTGLMPVYGSNDGALVIPLDSCDFTDLRPLLQLGTYITQKQLPFGPGPWDEDIFWLCGKQPLNPVPLSLKSPAPDRASFPHAGIYLLQGSNSRVILRCTDHQSRPSHADQLHVDLWMRGHNIAIDAGTYLYSGEGNWRNGLARTAVHNTVTVDHQDQMKMLTRFTWTDWSHGKVLRQDENIWQGEQDGYKRLPDPVNHKRTVMSLGEDRWLVVDHLTGKSQHHYALHWLLADSQYGVQERRRGAVATLAPVSGLWLHPSTSQRVDLKIIIQLGLLDGNSNFSIVRGDPNSTRGWRSQYYGEKAAAVSVMLEADQPQVTFWSYFGFEGDDPELAGDILRINSQQINLADLNK